MTVVRRALLVVASMVVANTASAGPIFMGREYEIVLAPSLTWAQARAGAQALGSGWDLATIGSLPENNFVEGALGSGYPDRSHFWLGATDTVTEGSFQWVDGTPFVFTDWAPFEPNDFGEDYLAFDLRGATWAWNDAENVFALGLVRGYVAERAVRDVPVPEPAIAALLAIGSLATALQRRRRASLSPPLYQ